MANINQTILVTGAAGFWVATYQKTLEKRPQGHRDR